MQTLSGRPVTPPVTIGVGGTVTLKILPETGERLPFAVTSVGVPVVEIGPVDNRVAAHFATVVLKGRSAGDTTIDIRSADGNRTAPVAVRVVARLVLPDADTESGLLARLFLAEVRVPDTLADLPDIAEAMTLMRVVLENRRAKPSGRWSSAGARTLADVVRAPGQFAGFGGYPALPADIAGQIADVVRIANQASDTRSPRMRSFVERVLAIASGARPRDPSANGLYWWRTARRGSPGTGVLFFRTVGGNTFWQEGR